MRGIMKWLGFRWAMPIGTFMVPVHPLLAPIVLIAALAWTATAFVAPGADLGITHDIGGEPRWTLFLIPIILLGIGLSIPILSWAVMAMGGRLIQAVLILLMLGAMTGDVFTGRADTKWLIVPISFTVFYLYLLIGGPLRAREIQRSNTAFQPITLGSLWLNAHHQTFAEGGPIKCGTAARIYSPSPKGKNRKQYRLSPDDGERFKKISNGLLPKRWRLTEREGYWTLSLPATGDEKLLTITRKPYRDPLGFLRGDLFQTVVSDGQTKHMVTSGQALVTRLPLFSLFHWTAIFGGKSQRVIGFDGQIWGELMGGENKETLALRQLLNIPEGPQFEREDLASLEAQILEIQPSFKEARSRFWHAMGAGGRYLNHKEDYNYICEHADECSDNDLALAIDWLRKGRERHLISEVHGATRLIELMPRKLWRANKTELLAAYNSRILAIRWGKNMVLPNGDRPYPKGAHVFRTSAGPEVGFGLMRDFPEFYKGLFRLSPEAEQVATAMILEARVIGMPLADSLDSLVPSIERGKP